MHACAGAGGHKGAEGASISAQQGDVVMPWCAVVYKHEYNTWSGAQGIDIGSILFQGLIR